VTLRPRIRISGEENFQRLLELIVHERIAIEEIGRQRISLERAFMELLK
jgi:hypothetical protein